MALSEYLHNCFAALQHIVILSCTADVPLKALLFIKFQLISLSLNQALVEMIFLKPIEGFPLFEPGNALRVFSFSSVDTRHCDIDFT